MSVIVYLAGGIAHNNYEDATQWRIKATEKLGAAGIQTRDPMRDKLADKWDNIGANHEYPGLTTAEIFNRDLYDISVSKALLVNLITAKSIGTPWEMGYAFATRKLLFVVAPPELHSHPFVKECATYLGTTVDDAIAAIAAYYNKSC